MLKYYKSLDGVRGIAALFVMMFHFFQHFGNDFPKFSKLSMFGQTGVDLFFVLSGFLITRILLFSKEKSNYFGKFYWKRTLRIFPLYYAFLLIYYFIMPWLGIARFSSLEEGIYHFTFLQNFAITFNWDFYGPMHYWSLAVEEHFYLFWPLLVYFFSRRGLKYLIFLVITIAFCTRIYFLHNDIGVFYFTFTRFGGLAFGALLALNEHKINYGSRRKFILCIIISLALLVISGLLLKGLLVVYYQVFKYLFCSLMYFGVIGYMISIRDNENIISKTFNTSFLQYTGKISYGLYVYHPLVVLFISKYLYSKFIILNFITLFALSYFISFMSFNYFEAYFLKFKGLYPFKNK